MTPKIICHIMSSVDGRLLPSRWTPPYGDTDPSELFKVYAEIGRELATDAWMFGKATVREQFPGRFMSKCTDQAKAGEVFRPESLTPRLFVTVDPDADIFFTTDKLRGDNIVVILGASATTDYTRMLRQRGVAYMVVDDITDLRGAMERLAGEFGVTTVSLQGGGIINGAMLAAALLDELSLVIYPGIDGNTTSPSIFEYLGASDQYPAEGQSMELLSGERRAHGVMWLRYRFHKNGD